MSEKIIVAEERRGVKRAFEDWDTARTWRDVQLERFDRNYDLKEIILMNECDLPEAYTDD